MRRSIILLTITILILSSCTIPEQIKKLWEQDPLSYYLEGDKDEREEMRMFLVELESVKDYERSYILIQQVVRSFHKAQRVDKMNLFLTNHVENNPEDPFNGYYLYLVAQNYMEEGAYPFAVHYFERILKNHKDLLIQDLSIHYICLLNLTELIDDPSTRAEYYKELLSRFGPNQTTPVPMVVDEGTTYYNLARTYEQMGEWNLSIQAYKNFLNFPDTIISGSPEIHKDISEKVAFYEYRNKDWTYEDLEVLKQRLQWAIYAKDPGRVSSFRAMVNFFTRSWEQQENDSVMDADNFFSQFEIFMSRRGRVSYRKDLDGDSNSQEAYLETFGWSYRIPTWYLYFRKVDFPADPEINGQWEWAGIYFGEKPFSGAN